MRSRDITRVAGGTGVDLVLHHNNNRNGCVCMIMGLIGATD